MNDGKVSAISSKRRGWLGKAIVFSCAAVILTYCTVSESANAVDGKAAPQDPVKKEEKLKQKLDQPAEKSATDKSKSHDKNASEKPAHDKKKSNDKKKQNKIDKVGPLKVIWIKVVPTQDNTDKRVFFEVDPSQDTDDDGIVDRSHFCFLLNGRTGYLEALCTALKDQDHTGVAFRLDPDAGFFSQKMEVNDLPTGPYPFKTFIHLSVTEVSSSAFRLKNAPKK